jgi:putative flippase GtrA
MSEIVRFIIFGSIGFFNAFLDIGIWRTLVYLFEKLGVKKNIYTISHTFSFFLTVVSSYFLNKTFTWADSNKVDNLQLYKFFGVAIFSWIITTWALNFLTSNDEIKKIVNTIGFFETNRTKKKSIFVAQWPTIAKLLTIIISMFTNFIGYKLFVF